MACKVIWTKPWGSVAWCADVTQNHTLETTSSSQAPSLPRLPEANCRVSGSTSPHASQTKPTLFLKERRKNAAHNSPYTWSLHPASPFAQGKVSPRPLLSIPAYIRSPRTTFYYIRTQRHTLWMPISYMKCSLATLPYFSVTTVCNT